MPLTTIEFEQIGPDHWVANLETGSLTSRRAQYRGATLGDVMRDAEAGYYELSGAPRPTAAPASPARAAADRLPPLRDRSAAR